MSSSPTPLKVGSFICAAIGSIGGGGGGVGDVLPLREFNCGVVGGLPSMCVASLLSISGEFLRGLYTDLSPL